MRISPIPLLLPAVGDFWQQLLAEQERTGGLIRRLTADAVVFQFPRGQLELPLSSVPPELRPLLAEGLPVTLMTDGGGKPLLKLSPPPAAWEASEAAFTELEGALVELDVYPSPEALRAAQALLERGFPLRKQVLLRLLPWAEQGRLEEALVLLEVGFPLTHSLAELVQELQGGKLSHSLQTAVEEELPEELRRALQQPDFAQRGIWKERLAEGELFKTLVRLLAAERLLEAWLNRGDQVNQFVFALPFLRDNQLFASWVRITKGPQGQEEYEAGVFRIRLEVPTASLGLVGMELKVRGKRLSLEFQVEERGQLVQDSLEALRQELAASGWQLEKFKVGGWDDAQGSSFTL